ncbi:MAG: hypothetical protein R3Y32_03860 [Bacillota bacterium]
MKIGSRLYVFDNSIFLIDRRRIFFIIAAVCTFAFLGRFIDNTMNFSVSAFVEYCKIDRIWFIAFVISNLIHFVTYYNSLKAQLKFIVTKDGLLVMQGGNLYRLPWNHIFISKKKNINFETEICFFIQDIKKLKDNRTYSDEYDKYFVNKTFVYKKEPSIICDEDKINRKLEKACEEFSNWQNSANLEMKNITTEKLPAYSLYSKLSRAMWGNTLISYIGFAMFYIIYQIIT